MDDDFSPDSLDDAEKYEEALALQELAEAKDAELLGEAPPVPNPGVYDIADKLGPGLFEEWSHVFQQHCVNNPEYAAGCFHLVFGQLPNIRAIKVPRGGGKGSYRDPRVHVAFLSPSATGKGEGIKFIHRMAEHLQLKVQNVDRVTDAGLIGTQQRDENNEIQYSPGWMHPSYGINILAAKEAGNLIKNPDKDREAQELMNTLQSTMNDLGSPDATISKKLAVGDPIEFGPELSVLLTSFLEDYMHEVLLRRGLFQRMYLIIKEPSQDDRDRDEARLEALEAEGMDYSLLEQDIAQRMLYVDQCYAGIEEMRTSPGCRAVFTENRKHMSTLIRGLPPHTQNMLSTFLTRFSTLRVKIALHFACLNLHSRIETRDAELAVQFTQDLLESIIDYLILWAKPSKQQEELVRRITESVGECLEPILMQPQYAKSKGFVSKERLADSLVRKYRLTPRVAQIYLDRMVQWGLGQYAEKDGVSYFRQRTQV